MALRTPYFYAAVIDQRRSPNHPSTIIRRKQILHLKAVLWQIASVFRYQSWIRIQDVSDTRRSLRTLYVTVQGARINSVKNE